MELHHVFNIRTQMYRRGSNGFITEKTILFGSRGGPTFSSGGGGGDVQILISIEPHITCDFFFFGGGGGGGEGGGGWGGVRTPCPPMDPHKNTEAVILIKTGV